MSATQDVSQELKTLEMLAREKPLAHPTAFELRHMGHEYAPPAHLVEIDQSVFEALHPERYPYAPKNLTRLFPREHGKSEAVSHKIPSWLALKNPNARILIMMESEEQAVGKLSQCRNTIRRLAPLYDREIESDAAKKLQLARSETFDVPTIRAAGFETSVTGGHYDLIIFDDLVSADSMSTETRRSRAWTTFQDYLNLGSAGKTVFVVVGTRKHPDDLYSKIMSSGGWDVEVRKAISDWSIVENGEYTVVCKMHDGTIERFDAGEKPPDATVVDVEPHRDVPVLWPERWPLDKLIQKYIEGTVEVDEGEDEDTLSGSLVWIRENQNRADALMGQVLDADMIHFVDGLPEDDERELNDLPTYIGMDLALEQDAEKAARNDTDYFAYCVATYDPRRRIFYIRDVQRKRAMTMKQAIDWVKRQTKPYNTRNLFVESNQAQTFFAQQAREEDEEGLRMFVKEVNSSGKKEDRIVTMSARFENGNAVIVGSPRQAKWDSLLREWTEFPTGDHDDRLDAMQIALSAKNQEDEESKKTVHRPFV